MASEVECAIVYRFNKKARLIWSIIYDSLVDIFESGKFCFSHSSKLCLIHELHELTRMIYTKRASPNRTEQLMVYPKAELGHQVLRRLPLHLDLGLLLGG